MTTEAVPREIAGVTYQDPITYVAAGGFDATAVRAVVNAYKAYYAAKRRGRLPAGHWPKHVSAVTKCNEALCTAIMRRYRAYYGKQRAVIV